MDLKAEISDLAAQYSALEAVVIGLMGSLQRHGTALEVIKDAFDDAEAFYSVTADRLGRASTQPLRSLQVIEELRKAAIGPH